MNVGRIFGGENPLFARADTFEYVLRMFCGCVLNIEYNIEHRERAAFMQTHNERRQRPAAPYRTIHTQTPSVARSLAGSRARAFVRSM